MNGDQVLGMSQETNPKALHSVPSNHSPSHFCPGSVPMLATDANAKGNAAANRLIRACQGHSHTPTLTWPTMGSREVSRVQK